MSETLPDPRLLREALLATRNPLARIALAASELEASGLAGDRARHGDAVRSGLAELDQRLEELARALERRSRVRECLSPDCRDEFTAVAARARIAAEARGVALRCEVAPQVVPGDPAAIRRATLRILRTACEWAGTGGEVRVALSREGLHARFDLSGVRAGRPARAERARDLMLRFAVAEGAQLEGHETLASDGLSVQLLLPAECAE
jgi:signal transduction histidine kinase